MISVADALSRILDSLAPLPAETVGVDDALGRILADDLVSRRTQPPVAVSAMDGFAVRAADVTDTPVTLIRIGEAPAGASFDGTVTAGNTVRIFTGGPVPRGADAIVMQENTKAEEDRVTVLKSVEPGTFVRPAGLDFQEGDVVLRAGAALSARAVGLAAAMNLPWLSVHRRPRVALLATGNELVRPGEPIGPNQIISSNSLALKALVQASGGEVIDLGIALDNRESLKSLAAGATGADMLVTLGGASVGDHDLVQTVLGDQGLEVDFWRIAMRPGKPLIFGQIAGTPMLGIPGNPVSALVCGLIFLHPAIRKLMGETRREYPPTTALLACDLAANDERQDYLRATLSHDSDGNAVVTPFRKQDSAMLSRIAQADCLVIRPPHAPSAQAGSAVDILPFENNL